MKSGNDDKNVAFVAQTLPLILFKDFHGADPNCPISVREGFKELEQLKAMGQKGKYFLFLSIKYLCLISFSILRYFCHFLAGLAKISEAFKLCKPLTSVDQAC